MLSSYDYEFPAFASCSIFFAQLHYLLQIPQSFVTSFLCGFVDSHFGMSISTVNSHNS